MASSAVVGSSREPLVKVGRVRSGNDAPIAMVEGVVVGFEVRPFQNKEDADRTDYKHELLLEVGRMQFKFIMWYPSLIDISDLQGKEVSFGVVYYKEDEYGRSLWRNGPRVVGYGRFPSDIMDKYAK